MKTLVKLFLFLMLLSIGASAQQTVLNYIYCTEQRPTSTTNSWAFGVDLREYDMNKTDIWLWYVASPKTTFPYTNARFANNLDSTLRTGEPYYYWYFGSKGHIAVNWVDTLITRAHNAGKKVVFSMGGIWGTDASNMSTIIADSTMTQTMIDTTSAWAQYHKFDGLEYDHEFPSTSAKDNVSRSIRITRRALDLWHTYNGQRALLIYTTNKTRVGACDPVVFNQYVDIIMPMLYGYGAGSPMGHNAALYRLSCSASTSMDNIDASGVKSWIAAGFNPSIVGALFPYEMKSQSGVLCGATAGGESYETYQVVLNAGGTEIYDQSGKVPYSFVGTKMYKYENPASFLEKVKYTKPLGILYVGGWDASRGVLSSPPAGHSKFELYDALYLAAKNGVVIPPPPPPPPLPTVSVCDSAFQRGFAAGKASFICPTCPPVTICPDTLLFYNHGWNAAIDATPSAVTGVVTLTGSATLPITKPTKK